MHNNEMLNLEMFVYLQIKESILYFMFQNMILLSSVITRIEPAFIIKVYNLYYGMHSASSWLQTYLGEII